jgi:hypothetical protein
MVGLDRRILGRSANNTRVLTAGHAMVDSHTKGEPPGVNKCPMQETDRDPECSTPPYYHEKLKCFHFGDLAD